MATPAFGFSVGDLIAGTKLMSKAVTALRNTSGATTSYQQAILDLEIMVKVLRQVQGLVPQTSNVEIIRSIQLCSLACHVPLDHFLTKVKELEPHMEFRPNSKDSVQQRLHAGVRKVQWAVVLVEDITLLKNDVSTGLDIIATLLQLETLERSAIAQADITQILLLAQKSLPVLARIDLTMQDSAMLRKYLEDFMIRLLALQQQIPSKIATVVADQIAITSKDLTTQLTQAVSRTHADAVAPVLETMRQEQLSGSLASFARDQTIRELRHVATESHDLLVRLADIVLPQNASVIRSSPATRARAAPNGAQEVMSPDAVMTQTVSNILSEGVRAVMFFFLLAGPMLQACLRSLCTIVRNPRFVTENKITFIDALNRELSLDYEHFCYWPVLLARLQVQFKGLPGEELVASNRFALLEQSKRAGQGTLISTEDWERSIFPGCRIVMSMPVEQQTHHAKICVTCGGDTWYENDGATAWLLCAQCGQNYQTPDGQSLSSHFIITPFPTDTPRSLQLNERRAALEFMVSSMPIEFCIGNGVASVCLGDTQAPLALLCDFNALFSPVRTKITHGSWHWEIPFIANT